MKQITKLPNRLVRVLVEGQCRGILHRVGEESSHFPEAVVEEIVVEQADEDEGIRREAMLRQLKELFRTFASHYPKLDKNASQRYARVDDLEKLIDQITMNLPVGFEHKQLVLE
ncbi:MAG: LON peptidase substrate-binding domain-containing protein, partial [Lachnospiraceae bacterium]|nr:LON peptidase substrate-binding domain-containing protein [Lachnospiraceae bacterium]